MATRLPLILGSLSFVATLPIFVGQTPVEVDSSVELRRALAGGGSEAPPPELLRDSWSQDPSAAADNEARLDDGAVDLVDSVQRGEWDHVELLSALQDPAFVSEQRLACADRYATEIETACSYRLEMLVERRDPSQGQIVHSRVRIHDHHLIDGEPSDPACGDFAMCIAGARLGQTVPMTNDDEPWLAAAQELYSPWADPRLFDAAYVRDLRRLYQGRVADHGDAPTFETPMQHVKYQFAANLVPYLDAQAARLEEGT